MSKRLGYFFSKGIITSRELKTMMFLFVQPFLVMKFVAIFIQKKPVGFEQLAICFPYFGGIK